ncbi:MAG: DNA polymerase III subunit delta [Candidatus Cloacimonadota bacterium]|nr:MAG: DNA polymerase III subunit delta [Candidatus Cloacimonadota bacterium]PIE77476.1 MAG: DNA polymerase III subunit delta [Candidatus Delongbacteria bacterium]
MAKDQNITTKDIENNTVFFLYGEERYLIDKAVEDIISHYVDDSFIDFNLDKLSEENISPELLSNSLYSMPVMSQHRVCFISTIDKMSVQIYQSLELFLSKDIDSTILIVTANKPDMRKKFFKTLGKKGISIQFKPKSEKDLFAWVDSYIKSKNRNISKIAINIIISTVKGNIKSLKSEIDKILLFDNNEIIDENTVTSLLGVSKEFNIFKLQESVVSRDLKNSLKIADQMLKMKESKNDPIGINLYFSKLFTSAFMISSNARKRKVSIAVSARDLGFTNPWRDKDVIKCSENYTLSELSRSLKYFLECDIKLKSGYQDSFTSLIIMFEKVIKFSNNRNVEYLNYFNHLNSDSN